MYQSFDLKQLRRENPNYIPKAPFEHQKDAFANLSKLYTFNDNSHKSGLLVLPTGAGKTFTSVNWICRNVVPKNKKVLFGDNFKGYGQYAYRFKQSHALQTVSNRTDR